MADFHKALNAARKNVPEVVSLRDLGWRNHSGSCLSTGLPQLDELLGGEGLPVGRMSEFYGPASAGKTSLVSRIMAEVTGRGTCVAYVDFFNSLSPEFLQAAGVQLENVLWVRGTGDAPSGDKTVRKDEACPGEGSEEPGREVIALRRALKQVEILMQSGNFTLVVLDVVEPLSARGEYAVGPGRSMIPKGMWFRLQRAVEKSKSVLILLSDRRLSSGASARVLCLQGERRLWGGGRSSVSAEMPPGRGIGNREKHALLLGMEAGVSIVKGGRNGRSILFHCHL